MERVQGHGALSHVHQALCNSDHEQIVGVLSVVLRKLKKIIVTFSVTFSGGQTCPRMVYLSQESGQSRVVRARPDQTHGKNGIVCHFGIRVVRKLAECILKKRWA